MKKIKIGNGTLFSQLDIDNLPHTPRTLSIRDFNGSQTRYNIYLEMIKTFKDYESRINKNIVDEPLFSENKNITKKHD